MKRENSLLSVFLGAPLCLAVILAPIALALWVGGLMFSHILFTAVGVDVSFWLDVLGGFVLHGGTLLLFVVSLIIRACGYDIPLFPIEEVPC